MYEDDELLYTQGDIDWERTCRYLQVQIKEQEEDIENLQKQMKEKNDEIKQVRKQVCDEIRTYDRTTNKQKVSYTEYVMGLCEFLDQIVQGE